MPSIHAIPLPRNSFQGYRSAVDYEEQMEVSVIGHNGSSDGASMMPPDPHDEFQELCALSITGELTPEELTRLEEHVSGCAVCKESQQEFERFVALLLPALTEDDG
jgi:hypothetical protein